MENCQATEKALLETPYIATGMMPEIFLNLIQIRWGKAGNNINEWHQIGYMVHGVALIVTDMELREELALLRGIVEERCMDIIAERN